MKNIFIFNNLIEIGSGISRYENKKHSAFPQFYHNRICDWMNIYGIRFRHKYFYIIIKNLNQWIKSR